MSDKDDMPREREDLAEWYGLDTPEGVKGWMASVYHKWMSEAWTPEEDEVVAFLAESVRVARANMDEGRRLAKEVLDAAAKVFQEPPR